MQAKRPDVLESELVANGFVVVQKFNEAILADSKFFLDLEPATTNFALPSKLVVHFFHHSLKQRSVFAPSNKLTQSIKAKHNGLLIDSRVHCSNARSKSTELLYVCLERQDASGDIGPVGEEMAEMGEVAVRQRV